jgi:hypothetical protein
MKQIVVGSTAVFAFAVPAMASEFDFRGAELTGTGYFNKANDIPADWTTVGLGGSFEFGFGGGPFFAQKDLTFQAYDMPWQDYYLGSLGGHLGYDIGNGLNIGAFATAELWDDSTGHASIGAEFTGRTGDFFYDGYGAYLFDPMNGTGWRQYHVEATGGYEFGDGFSLELGFHYGEGDLRFTDRMWQGLANVGYDLSEDIKIEAGYVYSDSANPFWDSHGVKLAFTKTFDGGTTFKQRNYLSVHNGY